MEIEKALEVYRSLIEQAMASGMFKKLDSLDIARSSYNSIIDHLKSLNDGKSKQDSQTEDNKERTTAG